jgi:hypothetical protein
LSSDSTSNSSADLIKSYFSVLACIAHNLLAEDVVETQLLILWYDGPLMNTTQQLECFNQTENLAADLLETVLVDDCDDRYPTRFGCVELVDTP